MKNEESESRVENLHQRSAVTTNSGMKNKLEVRNMFTKFHINSLSLSFEKW